MGEGLSPYTFRDFLALFSFRGRTTRTGFWIIIILAWLARFPVPRITESIAALNPNPRGLMAVLVSGTLAGILVWVTTATAFRRLHDRDTRGWWLVPRVLVPAMVLGWLQARDAPLSIIAGLIALLALALALWGLIEMGFRRGTKGDNRFGPDPLASPDDVAQEFS